MLVHRNFSDFAVLGVLYIESVATMCIVPIYGPFIWLRNYIVSVKRTISGLKSLYQILQVGNLQNLAKTKQVGSFCRINFSKLLTHTRQVL